MVDVRVIWIEYIPVLVCGACETVAESTNTENTNCAITEGRKNVQRKAEKKVIGSSKHHMTNYTMLPLLRIFIWRKNSACESANSAECFSSFNLFCLTCMENASLASGLAYSNYITFFCIFCAHTHTNSTQTKSESIKVGCMASYRMYSQWAEHGEFNSVIKISTTRTTS